MNTKKLTTIPGILFCIYFIFTLVNLILHFADYYVAFLGMTEDYVLYGIKLALCLVICIVLSAGRYTQYRAIDTIMRIMIPCDIAEIVLSALITDTESLAGGIFMLIQIAKLILTVLFILLAFEPGRNLELFKEAWKPVTAMETFLATRRRLSRKAYIVLIPLTIAIIVALLHLRYTKVFYHDRPDYEGDERWPKDTYIYVEKNLMPEWSGCYKLYPGLVDSKTGERSERSYEHMLDFDDNGIAWDYEGHFIDKHGNVVLTVDKAVYEKKSLRSWVLISSMKRLYKRHNPTYVHWYGREAEFSLCRRTYFSNNVAVFHSARYGACGLINDKGEIITKPEIFQYSSEYDYEVIPVFMKRSGKLNALNGKGEYILSDAGHVHRWVYHERTKLISCQESEYGTWTLYDINGNHLNPDSEYRLEGGERGDILVASKILSVSPDLRLMTVAIDGTGKEIYESEQYSDYEAYAESDGTIRTLRAKRCDEDIWDEIDLSGR